MTDIVSTSSVTLHHELLEMIDNKYVDGPLDEQVWPTMGEVSDDDDPCRQIWNSMRSNPIYPPAPIDISSLHPEWAVVSLGVSDDLATLLITRHQKDVSPIVLCLPFDRQGKREIDDDGFPFKMARDEMVAIVDQSDESARGAKHVTTNEGRIEWWDTRHELDKRLGELLEGIETNWFGAFKVGFHVESELMASLYWRVSVASSQKSRFCRPSLNACSRRPSLGLGRINVLVSNWTMRY